MYPEMPAEHPDPTRTDEDRPLRRKVEAEYIVETKIACISTTLLSRNLWVFALRVCDLDGKTKSSDDTVESADAGDHLPVFYFGDIAFGRADAGCQF